LRRWKLELQSLADELRLALRVRYFPPGASRWNGIEHRMFCHITQNWSGRALVSRQAVVNLIGQTTPAQGLRIRAKLDAGKHQTGIKVTDDQLVTAALEPDAFHGEWNHTIQPRG
jgi:hypothetical protein